MSRAEDRINRRIESAASTAATSAIARVPAIVGAALDGVPVRDTPRGPAVISDAAALYLLVAHAFAHGTPEQIAAMEADRGLVAWFEYMTPAPIGDRGG
ncbi:MAG: hypothetical protein AB7G21_10015 [Dehalococcoidia bacterium]